MKVPTQTDKHETSNIRRWLKKTSSRLRRRWEKRDIENAPKRNPYKGYSG